MTYDEQLQSVLRCENRAEAIAWLEAEINRYGNDYGKNREDAERLIRGNIFFMARRYSFDVERKVRDLFAHEFQPSLT